ncbi:MAG: DNA repair protein RecO [Acidimicrobiales bacterium]|nr:DNA repair protein RecO [Acidimicrobiales bacterium]
MALYRDEGIVLRTWRLGEADRIVVIMTRGRGKVRAVAKGVRKTKSKFGARLEPTSHVALQFYEGRELDIVTQAETIDHFRSIRDDLDRLAKATAMFEAVDHVAPDREANAKLFAMLLGALRALAAADSPLVVPAFFLKVLALEGYRPVLDECVLCGTATDLVAFDADTGGTLCRSCRRGGPISAEALGLLRRILGGQLGAALNEPPSAATHEVDQLATRALEHHLERRLRSVHII